MSQCKTVLPGFGACILSEKHGGPHKLNTETGAPELLVCPDYDIRTGNPCILPYRHKGHCRTKERTYTQAELDAAIAAAREADAALAYNTPFPRHAADSHNFHSGCVQTRNAIVERIRKCITLDQRLAFNRRDAQRKLSGEILPTNETKELIDAAIAAARREDAELLHKRGHDRAMLIIEESITPEQRSALDKHDAEVREKLARPLVERWRHVVRAFTSPFWNQIEEMDAVKAVFQCANELATAAGLNTDTSGQSTQGEGRKEGGK